MPSRTEQRETTRLAILEALTQVITENGALEFSIQQVADRAGVTHRTVYNHFPTRDALNDEFGVFVDEQMAAALGSDKAPDDGVAVSSLGSIVAETYQSFGSVDEHLHASVMLMLATGKQAKRTQERTERYARLMESEFAMSPSEARLGAAALRMFLSSTGWHVLTQQLGLSQDEAVKAAEWASNALLAELERGSFPESTEAKNDDA